MARTNHHRLNLEIEAENGQMQGWSGRETFAGPVTAARRQADVTGSFEIAPSRPPPCSCRPQPAPAARSNGRARRLRGLSRCFPPWRVPSTKRRAFRRKSRPGGVAAFAAVGGMGSGAFVRRRSLRWRGFCKESPLPRPHVRTLRRFSAPHV